MLRRPCSSTPTSVRLVLVNRESETVARTLILSISELSTAGGYGNKGTIFTKSLSTPTDKSVSKAANGEALLGLQGHARRAHSRRMENSHSRSILRVVTLKLQPSKHTSFWCSFGDQGSDSDTQVHHRATCTQAVCDKFCWCFSGFVNFELCCLASEPNRVRSEAESSGCKYPLGYTKRSHINPHRAFTQVHLIK